MTERPTVEWTYRTFVPLNEQDVVRYQILDERGDVVAVVCRTRIAEDEPADVHADRIVRAVNCHADLVAALDSLVANYGDKYLNEGSWSQARAALAKAKN